MKNYFMYVLNPRQSLKKLLWRSAEYIKNDRLYIYLKYILFVGRIPDLKHPKTFTEKLQWLKLNDRNPIYHRMADKVEMKEYVREIIGDGYTIPTLGVWDSFDEIDFNKLPEQFILKCTHDSGSYTICKNKSTFQYNKVKELFNKSLQKEYYVYSREWPYKNLKKRIIAEPLLKDASGKDYLVDYKFHTFMGEPKFFYVTTGRKTKQGLSQHFFNLDGTKITEFSQASVIPSKEEPLIPNQLKTMIMLARKLAKNTYYLRVDFYEINNSIYVGELTFFDGGGFDPFTPRVYEYTFGAMINLPIKNAI